ncbi:MAG: hypothetical protein KME28_02790 [Pelatocladus maniniholoensis HA4357-MV3]|jgi:hypothetical protein|uniref:Uncharacterized protein n=1 Tax=Pelatocladus maniniholoensis HA4357-MV3 TaxID=1117104 RepID=A0A9E3LSA1_9NOST|nr:hypothetical protein [Pelatocladus maniniholoensis HA4357-MV3]BAZ70322.1 hypothetical protein NIES4106_51140 [Fischerella sp. NIES-4106]
MSNYLLLLFIFVNFISGIYPASAHKVKTTADVGATLHMEPNDTPRAGEATRAWFALTRKGGKVIPLTQCDCQLLVYAEPHASGEPPLLEPRLKSVSAERYKGIPGAEITFPRAGSYQLLLLGKPTVRSKFKPFQLKYRVTVAVGAAQTKPDTQVVKNVNQNITEKTEQGIPIWAIAALGFFGMGVLLFVVQRVNKD